MLTLLRATSCHSPDSAVPDLPQPLPWSPPTASPGLFPPAGTLSSVCRNSNANLGRGKPQGPQANAYQVTSVVSDSCDPVDCSPPGSPVRGILQARGLEWVAMPSSRGSSRPRDRAHVSHVSSTGRWILYHQRHLGSLMPDHGWGRGPQIIFIELKKKKSNLNCCLLCLRPRFSI